MAELLGHSLTGDNTYNKICKIYPFMGKMFDQRKELDILIRPQLSANGTTDTDDIIMLKNNLADEFLPRGDYEISDDKETEICIFINKLQKTKLYAHCANENGIDSDSLTKHLTRYTNMLLIAYKKYGKTTTNYYRRLHDINDMSRQYTRDPINMLNPLYKMFNVLYLEINTYLSEVLTRVYKLAIDNKFIGFRTLDTGLRNKWTEIEVKIIEQKVIEEKETDETIFKVKRNYYSAIFRSFELYKYFKVIILEKLIPKLKVELSYINKHKLPVYHNNDDKLLFALLCTKCEHNEHSSEQISVIHRFISEYKASEKQYDTTLQLSGLTPTYIQNMTLPTLITLEEFKEQCFLIHYINPLSGINPSSTTEPIFENYKLILEIRNIQIKIYYILFVITTQLYYTWLFDTQHLSNTNEASRRAFVKHNLQLIDVNMTHHTVLCDHIYDNITKTGVTNADLKQSIRIYIDNLFSSLLENIETKYLIDIKNLHLYNALITHDCYTIFCTYIIEKITDLCNNYQELLNTGDIKFDTIYDPLTLRTYLVYENALMFEGDILELDRNMEANGMDIKDIDNYNERVHKVRHIYTLYKTHQKTFDLDVHVPDANIRAVFPMKMGVHGLRFLFRIIFPETEYLNIEGDLTDPKNIVTSRRTHPNFRHDPIYNIGCNVFKNKDILKSQIYGMYGMTKDLFKYKFCNSSYEMNKQIYNLLSISYFFDLTQWSHTTDYIYLYLDTIRDNKELLYVRDPEKKRMPLHHATDKKYMKSITDNIKINCIYIGSLQIPMRRFRNMVLFIFWNKPNTRFMITDALGEELLLNSVLYEPFITWIELEHLHKYYKKKLYKKKGCNNGEFIFSNIREGDENIQEVQLRILTDEDNPNLRKITIVENDTQHAGNNNIRELMYYNKNMYKKISKKF
jgi:hypothetical protein